MTNQRKGTTDICFWTLELSINTKNMVCISCSKIGVCFFDARSTQTWSLHRNDFACVVNMMPVFPVSTQPFASHADWYLRESDQSLSMDLLSSSYGSDGWALCVEVKSVEKCQSYTG